MDHSLAETLFFAVFGSLAVNARNIIEALRLKLVDPGRSPERSNWIYWLIVLMHAVLAAGVAYAYHRTSQNLSPILAMQVGASAPLILQALARVAAPPPSTPAGA